MNSSADSGNSTFVPPEAGPSNNKAAPVGETTERGGEQQELSQCAGTLAVGTQGDKTETGPATGSPIASTGLRSLILGARKDPSKISPLLSTRKEVVEVTVHKTPPKHLFWRARADSDPLLFDLFRGTSGKSEEFFLIASEGLSGQMKEDPYFTKFVESYQLILIIDPKSTYAWWPIRVTSDNAWHLSAKEIAILMESSWGRIQSGEQKYNFLAAEDDLGPPDWPKDDDLGMHCMSCDYFSRCRRWHPRDLGRSVA